MSTELILICHGQSVRREENRLLGWWSDVSLSPKGRQQALLLGERLQSSYDIQSVFTSPLTRARETANLIGDMVRVVPTVETSLRELDAGALSRLSYEEAKVRFPDVILRGKSSGEGHIPGGESYADLHRRVAWGLERIIAQCLNQQIAVVTHGGPIVTYLRSFLGYESDQRNKPRFICDVASVHHLKIDEDGEKTVFCLNDSAHLAEMPE